MQSAANNSAQVKQLKASESAASGQFRLIGENDTPHMAGSWQPLEN